jgi:hypothetical protein
MKNAIILLAFVFISFYAMGQSKTPVKESTTCFDEYYSLFRSRGANPVADGTHQVVISVRKEGRSRCFMGKVEVKGGAMTPPILIENLDGSFEPLGTEHQLIAAYRSTPQSDLMKIVNGMSITALTTDEEEVKVFFVKSLKDKVKSRKPAPPPGTM